jgi:hypothetical protein
MENAVTMQRFVVYGEQYQICGVLHLILHLIFFLGESVVSHLGNGVLEFRTK